MNLIPELFKVDKLSLLVGIFVVFFSLLITVYSLGFIRRALKRTYLEYYTYIFLTLLASLGVVFANNLILLMVFWGFLGLLLYLLIGLSPRENAPYTAKKTFIIIGGTDALMLLGLAFIWQRSGLFQMDLIKLTLNTPTMVWAYLCLAVGAFAKAGVMPFHTWVPDTAEDAPLPVAAYLPASLDKLLGIYLLVRISLDLFQMNTGMNTFLMAIGSFTIVAAGMMALVQNDFKRLLGYCAVSQVGYIVLGIGTANPIGIAGGLFHMLNHAIYKSCLFLSAGAVEKRSGVTSLEKLGGLAKVMPLVFGVFLIASLAVSGVPPFNGFVSKWMVYQGVIETAAAGNYLWVVWLVAAMFGSALTLATFMKLIQAVFLGQPATLPESFRSKSEANWAMLAPMLILALLCVGFGVFAYSGPLKMGIFPALGQTVTFSGLWNASLATTLIIGGIIAGALIYFFSRPAGTRKTSVFVGGEEVSAYPRMRVSGVDFYNTIQEVGCLRLVYRLAKAKFLDIYELGARLTFGCNKWLRRIHNGVLSSYLSWCLLGMIILFIILLK